MPPHVAYLITSYKLPHQTLRLASVLRKGSPRASIVVHHDNRRCSVDRVGLEALSVQLVEPASAAEWGEFSQLAVVLRCFRWLLTHAEFDWVILLSGQDYPVRPVAQFEQWLATAGVDACIETVHCGPPPFRRPIDEFASRYYYRWRRLPATIPNRFARAAATGRPLLRSRIMANRIWVGMPALRSPFGLQLICYRGLDWFTLSRRAVEAVDRFVQTRPEVAQFIAAHSSRPSHSSIR